MTDVSKWFNVNSGGRIWLFVDFPLACRRHFVAYFGRVIQIPFSIFARVQHRGANSGILLQAYIFFGRLSQPGGVAVGG